MSLLINDLEKEIFKEIVNIGLAKAADAFAIIAKEKVLISAPEIQIIEVEKIYQKVPNYDKFDIVIESNLTGDLSGKTFLLFSKEQSDKLAEICLGSLKVNESGIDQLKTSLLLEVGNIITGSLVTQLSNILQLTMFGSVPELKNNYLDNILKKLDLISPIYKPFLFTVKTEFVYSWKSLDLPFILVFDINAFMKILAIIRNFNNKEGLFRITD